MTLLEEIQAKCSPELIAARDDYTITQTVNAGRVRPQSFTGGIGSIMRALGPVDGATFLDTLEYLAATQPTIKWAMRLIEAGNLDFGDVAVRAQIDGMVPSLLTTERAAALKALGEVADPVQLDDVSRALNAAGIGV